MKRPGLKYLSLLLFAVLPVHLKAQAKSPSQRLLMARATYYTPTTDGLHSFDCKLSVDWKDFLTRANAGKDVPDDNPALQYLRAVTMTLHDDLASSATVQWTEASPAPENLQESTAKIKSGIIEMLSGYFTSWNAYLNGTMVPIPDKTTTITITPDGIHLSATTSTMKVDEDFDQNMLLIRAHVITNGTTDIIAMPTFRDSDKGRIISEVKNEVREPTTAPPIFVTMGADYQTVGRYEIPSKLHFDIRNMLRIDFALDSCAVNRTPTKP